MQYTVTTFDYPAGKRDEVKSFCASIADKVKLLGAASAVLLDLGDGKAANLSAYASPADAERGTEKAKALYSGAVEAGLIVPGSINRQSGPVWVDYLK